MRFCLTSLLVVVLVTFAANSQEMPTSYLSCGVSASALMECEGLSTPLIRWKNSEASKLPPETSKVPPEVSKLPPKGVFVMRVNLSPGALLPRIFDGDDILIVGMCDGELANEAKAAKTHVNITNGFVMLMPKEEPYLLRNIGQKDLDLVLIEVKK